MYNILFLCIIAYYDYNTVCCLSSMSEKSGLSPDRQQKGRSECREGSVLFRSLNIPKPYRSDPRHVKVYSVLIYIYNIIYYSMF